MVIVFRTHIGHKGAGRISVPKRWPILGDHYSYSTPYGQHDFRSYSRFIYSYEPDKKVLV